MTAGRIVIVLALALSALGAPGPGGVLDHLILAPFGGPGQATIQAITTDPAGYIYIAGTALSADLPAKNAFQPRLAEARLMRSDDLGATWTPAGNPPLTNPQVIADPVVPGVLFAAGSTGIYKSNDGGQTWRAISSDGITSMVIDPANHLRLAAITAAGTLRTSVDGGETWNTAAGPPPGNNGLGGTLLAEPGGTGVLLYVFRNFTFHLWRDWGGTYQAIRPPDLWPTAAAFHPTRPGSFYLSTTGGTLGQLWLTTDYGVTWTLKTAPTESFSAIENLFFSSSPAPTLFATTVIGFQYASADGAASWTRVNLKNGGPTDPRTGLFANPSCSTGSALLTVTAAGAVATSFDGGSSWREPQLGAVNSLSVGPGCTVYAGRAITSDAFVARLTPDGALDWATYLGGSARDFPIGLALDAAGNVYVAGNTDSSDFPANLPRIGVRGITNCFVSKFTATGALAYSVVLGGDAVDRASAFSVDAAGNAILGGSTSSPEFPVTAGSFGPNPPEGNAYSGFLTSLAADGSLRFGAVFGSQTRLNNVSGLSLLPNGETVFSGTGYLPGEESGSGFAFLARVDASGARLTYTAYPSWLGYGATALASNPQGDIYVTGTGNGGPLPSTPGAYVSPRSADCSPIPGFYSYSSQDVYIVKLSAGDFQPVYAAQLAGKCGSQAGALQVNAAGEVFVSLIAGTAFPLVQPYFGGNTSQYPFQIVPIPRKSAAVAKLSADGASLLFSTYLDTPGVPPIAVTSDGALLAGALSNGQADLLKLDPNPRAPLSLNAVVNAFSGDPSAVVPGSLVSLLIPELKAEWANAGLAPGANLPRSLSDTEVTFDGVPAEIFETTNGRITVQAPTTLAGSTIIEVVSKCLRSTRLIMPVVDSNPGLLSRAFPEIQVVADGNVRNQDNSENDAQHPAPPGSLVTVFATGINGVQKLFSSWGGPVDFRPVPGFIPSLYQAQLTVPNSGLSQASIVGLNLALSGPLKPCTPCSPVPVRTATNTIRVYVGPKP